MVPFPASNWKSSTPSPSLLLVSVKPLIVAVGLQGKAAKLPDKNHLNLLLKSLFPEFFLEILIQ